MHEHEVEYETVQIWSSVTSAGLHPADASAVGQGVEVMRMNGKPKEPKPAEGPQKGGKGSKGRGRPGGPMLNVWRTSFFNENAHR